MPRTERGDEQTSRVRDTDVWMTHVADLEAEMTKRGTTFEFIAWDQAIDGLSDGSLTEVISG